MKRILAALALTCSLASATGCAPIVTAETFTGEWVFVSGTDAAGIIDPKTAEIDLTIQNKTVSGHVCNSFSGEFTGRATNLTVGPIASTEMYCTEPEGIMDLETRFLTDLDAITAAFLVDGKLVLSGQDITLEFDAAG